MKRFKSEKNLRFKVVLFWLLFLHMGSILAAENDFQLWTNLTATGTVSKEQPKVKYWFESQGRFGENASTFSQFLVRPGIGYQLLPSTSVWIGYAWIHTSLPFATTPNNENRIWQQILWNNKSERFLFTLRSRLEQRSLPNTLHTAWRYRQLLKISYFIPHHEKFTLIGMEEIFYHMNNFNQQKNSGLDQNRAFIGIGIKATAQSTIEVGYLNQNIRRNPRADFNGNCLYLSLLLSN
ncbi:DUF2490 domain-containing protein [uncultured Legionella sp.]|uniref:DUF2490 domain-containing protein n=1 Tax=uncultured Legionella sp. TaxID=210934 RepID=UPI002638AA19|nr:DUF2490 domain-containing protein [uncultured Legionella sp.]